MEFGFITFPSLTAAQKAESLLRKSGIVCNVQRTPRYMQEQGCGYGLRIESQGLWDGISVLADHDIAYKRVYLQRKNGRMEEIGR